MSSTILPQLNTGWHVDQAILSENDRIVVIRFGREHESKCMFMDQLLSLISEKVKNFSIIYLCNIDKVTDFNQMYELDSDERDPFSVMFFYRNKHMLCDFGTGNNNKLNFMIYNKQELIDTIETIYRGAVKGKGLVVNPTDYSTSRK